MAELPPPCSAGGGRLCRRQARQALPLFRPAAAEPDPSPPFRGWGAAGAVDFACSETLAQIK